MIGKLTKGSSASGLINYLLQPKQNAMILGAEGVSTVTRQGIVNGFDMHIRELGRENVKQPIGHISLSWSPDDCDKLSDELMLKVAREYMREMGFVDIPYVVVRHNCTSHPHLHIAYSRVNYYGKVLQSSNDFRRNARVCRMLTQKYGFKIGDKRGKSEIKKLKGADERRQNIRLKAFRALDNSHSWQQFNRRLAQDGISLSFRMNGRKDGLAGIVFGDGTNTERPSFGMGTTSDRWLHKEGGGVCRTCDCNENEQGGGAFQRHGKGSSEEWHGHV